MRIDYAGIGDRLPNPETPDEATLEAYGAFAFLYLRSRAHRGLPLELARRMIQPALDWGLFHVIRDAHGVPRAGVTWAWLDPDAQSRHAAGEILSPGDWRSGANFWVMELIAPFGQETGSAVACWLRRTLPASIRRVNYLRYTPDQTRVARIVTCTRGPNDQWRARLLTAEELQGLDAPHDLATLPVRGRA